MKLPNAKATASIIVALLGLIGTLSTSLGFELPFTGEQATAGITAVVALLGVVSTAWHNTNLTEAANYSQAVLDALKAGQIEPEQVEELLSEPVTVLADQDAADATIEDIEYLADEELIEDETDLSNLDEDGKAIEVV